MITLIDLHCHTVSSGHAYSTVKENIEEAKAKGLKYLGISDHGPMMPGGPHIYHFYNLRVFKNEIDGVRVLKGAEVNILNSNGEIDLPEDVLGGLDYTIASLHPPCFPFASIEENTQALINAMKNPFVKIIGHPDDSRYPLNYEELVINAKKHKVALEVNNSSLKEDSYREGAKDNVKMLLEECKRHNAFIILGSDAHIYYEVGEFNNIISILEEVNFPKELILNYNEEALKEFLTLE